MQPVTILHDLLKPIHANGEMTEKNLQFLEEYLDLLIRTFEMAEAASMLLVVLHFNNLRPMYKKSTVFTFVHHCVYLRLGNTHL
jgi:hypothetical protein